MRRILTKANIRAIMFTGFLLLGVIIFIAEAYAGRAGFSSFVAGVIVSSSTAYLIGVKSRKIGVVCVLLSGISSFLGPAVGLPLSVLLPVASLFISGRKRYEISPAARPRSRGVLVVAPSIGSICSLTAQISLDLALSGRKLVVVDWDGSVPEALREKGVPFRQARWKDISFSYSGRLGPNYLAIVSIISSLITGIGAEVIASSMRERASVELPETVRVVRDIIVHEGVLLDDAMPGLGPLVINASDLDLMSKDLVSALVILQSLSFGYRDFILVVPIISPISESSLRAAGGRIDIVEWVLREAVRRGCVVITGPEPSVVALREFDSFLIARGVYSVMGRDLSRFLPDDAKRLVKSEVDVLVSGGSAEPFQIGASSLGTF